MAQKRTLILTATKPLQRQYVEWFKETGLLEVKGRSNYFCKATEVSGEFYDGSPATSVEHGPCQYGMECSLRQDGCTYYDLLRRAKYEYRVVGNYDLWLYSNLYSDGIAQFPLIMLDEAHNAESRLSNAMTINLPKSYEAVVGDEFPIRSKIPKDWARWAVYLIPETEYKYKLAKQALKESKRGGRTKAHQRVSTLSNAVRILSQLSNITEDWLVMPSADRMSFAPVWVDKYAEAYLFRGAQKVVMASATIRPHVLSSLGVSKDDADFFEYPSTFPIARRPIYFLPVAKMRYDMDGEDVMAVLKVIDDIIEARLDRKGLIHTVSFARTKMLLQYSKHRKRMIACLHSGGAELAVKKFEHAGKGSILVGPSFGEGWDFPYKACEYIIVPKIPFADSSHPIQQARAAANASIGFYDAGTKLQQYLGRGDRAEDDQCEMFITDAMFNLYRTSYPDMISNWVWEAVKTIDELPEPLPCLQ